MAEESGWSPNSEKEPPFSFQSRTEPQPDQTSKGPKSSIWLIEDNPADVLLIREALNEHNVNAGVMVVRDGETAFTLINELESGKETCPDLVILDLNLPRKSGREILQLMRGGEKCGRIPVVILTSSNAASDRNEAAQLGATRYVRKPSNLEEFMKIGAVVTSVLSGPSE